MSGLQNVRSSKCPVAQKNIHIYSDVLKPDVLWVYPFWSCFSPPFNSALCHPDFPNSVAQYLEAMWWTP
jgi:hypothetical protein